MAKAESLTLQVKTGQCRYCEHADIRAMRKGWNHCQSEYKNRNGHCRNFKPKGDKFEQGKAKQNQKLAS